MSVQAGIWNFDGKPIDRRLLQAFGECLTWQGPDGETNWTEGPNTSIALLYYAFHTTRESRREKQPFVTGRGFVLTWDGRLDNRDDLKQELHSCLDSDPTDVALIAAAFDRWGTSCFARIIGDWAVAIWKPEHRELVFSADYMAIRHIFYCLRTDQIWWSTDLKPLVLFAKDQFEIDDEYMAGYFALAPDAHLTPYKAIRQVAPGHFTIVQGGRATVERYWHFSPKSRIRYRLDSEYEEHFRHVFRESVRRRLRSDSRVLAELSGGLDSSSIVCMADAIGNSDPRTASVDTLSYFDKTEPHGDDCLYFQKIEQHRGKVGFHIDSSKYNDSPSFEDNQFSALPNALGFRSRVEGERSAILHHGGYRVVLSGIGGDEFMGGVPNPASQIADSLVQFRILSLARQLWAWSLVKRRPWMHLFARALAELVPASLAKYFLDQAKVEPWIRTSFAKRGRIAVRQLDVREHFGLILPSRRSCIGAVLHMSNVLAKSVIQFGSLEEARYPFLDRTLIEFVLSIPATQLLRPGERRSLMRRALVGIVPDDVLSRRTKQFSQRTPLIALASRLGRLRDIFASPLSSEFGYIDPQVFLNHLDRAVNGDAIHTVKMLNTIALELWMQDLASRRILKTAPV